MSENQNWADYGTQELDTRQQVSSREELDALPDFTVLVANKVFPGTGAPAVIAAEKIAGAWYFIGSPAAVPVDGFADVFFPADVVFKL